ncbi:MAG: restriction endonuclease [Phycisphaerales bacterium]|nr:restriction endonuclease [Phycisphaerales bacterium]
MRRRRNSEANPLESLYTLFLVAPRWAGPVVAILAFALGTAVNRLLGALFGGGVLFAWLMSMTARHARRANLDRQSGVASIRRMSWREFESLMAEAYRRQGFTVEERGGGGADGGVDILLRRNGETVVVQCKHWKAWKVGVRTVREVYGVMTAIGATRAVIAACGAFTGDAVRFATGRPIELLDGESVWRLVQSVRSGDSTPEIGNA